MKFLQKGVKEKMKILHYLKRFILFVIKEVLSFFIKLFLFLFIVGIIISAVIKNFEEKPAVTIKNKAYVLINLADSYNERLLKSNLFENIEFKQFDMIVSNPPYISLNEVGIMSDDTLLHEPSEALFAENDGLYFYYEICQKAFDYLADFGYLLFEIGYKQGKNVAKIMASSGFKNIEVVKDLAGLDRVVIGQKIINKIEN